MKKIIIFSVLLLGASVLFLVGFIIVHVCQNHELAFYDRFTSKETGHEKFNWWGLLSPLQIESQKTERDTIRFTHRVRYPLAPKFEFINPGSDTAEAYVGRQIAKVIADSANRVFFNRSLDYDRTSLAVRSAANPATRTLKPPIVSIGLLGTASPEAVKYGLRESLQPGHVEPENLTLAKQRLDRTKKVLVDDLAKSGISVANIKTDAEELQLRKDQVEKAIADPKMLDTMRYVSADITMIVSRLRITPATAPILLPLWIGLAALCLPLLRRIIKSLQPKPIYANRHEEDFREETDASLEPEKEYTLWMFLDWIGIRKSLKYWYFSYDHPDHEKVSASVISSRDRYFPAHDAHEKIHRLMQVSDKETSLHIEIHHHIRISYEQYFRILMNEHRKKE